MVKLLIVLVVSFFADVKGSSNEISTDDECSCSSITDQFNTAIDKLLTRKELSCRKKCPSGFDYLPEVDGCFKVIFQPVNWYQAGEVCRKVMPGVHLGAITDSGKQNAIENYLKQELKKVESSACIDTFYTSGEKWVWISGQTKDPIRCRTPFVWRTLEGIEIPFNYTNWRKTEPNCYSGTENCVHLGFRYQYGWNDLDCRQLFCALCEY